MEMLHLPNRPPSHLLIMTSVPTSTDNVLASSLLTSFTFIYPGRDDEVRVKRRNIIHCILEGTNRSCVLLLLLLLPCFSSETLLY
jgi:hypothetical protein